MKVRRFKLTENDTERKGEEKGKGSKENRIESSETDKLMKEKKKTRFQPFTLRLDPAASV